MIKKILIFLVLTVMLFLTINNFVLADNECNPRDQRRSDCVARYGSGVYTCLLTEVEWDSVGRVTKREYRCNGVGHLTGTGGTDGSSNGTSDPGAGGVIVDYSVGFPRLEPANSSPQRSLLSPVRRTAVMLQSSYRMSFRDFLRRMAAFRMTNQ